MEEEVKGTITDNEEKKEEAKEEKKEENSFKKFFKKAKENINTTTLEMKIEHQFNSINAEFTLYINGMSFNTRTFHAEAHEGYILAYGSVEAEKGMVLEDNDNHLFSVVSVEASNVSVTLDGKSYEKMGTKISYNEELTKVDVIRVKDTFYIKNK